MVQRPMVAAGGALSYLCHMGRIRGMTTTAARSRGGELLARLALEGGPDSSLRELSKGNAQRSASRKPCWSSLN